MGLFILLALIMLFLGIFSRALGYGINRGAPWLLGITPDAFLRFANTLLLLAIAIGVSHMVGK